MCQRDLPKILPEVERAISPFLDALAVARVLDTLRRSC
jgi:hypothetical protein